MNNEDGFQEEKTRLDRDLTRTELAETIAALQHKFDLTARGKDAVHEAKAAMPTSLAEGADRVAAAIRTRPLIAVCMALLLGFLLSGIARGTRKR